MKAGIVLPVIAIVGLSAFSCEPRTKNCPNVGVDNAAGFSGVVYTLLIPSECPVPLASPGNEKKFASAQIADGLDPYFVTATVVVTNSKGNTVGVDQTTFFGGGSAGVAIALLKAEYIAATGTRTFDDHDIATFTLRNAQTTSRAKTKITYRQSNLATQLQGPAIPQPNGTYTWSAPVTGGYPGFTYQWYRDDQVVGTGSTYTGAVGVNDFGLRVEVTDQTWSTVAAVLAVEVGGVRGSIVGPTQVWASVGGGTWTASGAGGNGVYSFEWWLDEQLVGTGSSWQGYTGEGENTLTLITRDSAGKQSSTWYNVLGIGAGDGVCDPPPGQDHCAN